jgi:5-bromo-4-chloroindolyl phosphate hydrolysis protein
MLSVLTDTQRAIVETMVMRLSTRQSLLYLKEHGYEMSESKYFRNKKKVESMKLKRLHHIAEIGFELQHLERIDQLQLISKEMWKCYHDESQPLKKVKILWYLVTIQPYLSQYYEATMDVIKQSANPKQYYVPKLEHADDKTL